MSEEAIANQTDEKHTYYAVELVQPSQIDGSRASCKSLRSQQRHVPLLETRGRPALAPYLCRCELGPLGFRRICFARRKALDLGINFLNPAIDPWLLCTWVLRWHDWLVLPNLPCAVGLYTGHAYIRHPRPYTDAHHTHVRELSQQCDDSALACPGGILVVSCWYRVGIVVVSWWDD